MEIFEDKKFAVASLTAKSVKIMSLKNYRIYGNLTTKQQNLCPSKICMYTVMLNVGGHRVHKKGIGVNRER